MRTAGLGRQYPIAVPQGINLASGDAWLSKKLFLLAGGIFLGTALLIQGGVLLARWKYEGVRSIYLSRQLGEDPLQAIAATLKQATQLDPFDGMYPFLLGDVERYLQHPDKALEHYVQAARRDPLDGAYLQRIALMLPEEHRQYAEILMEKGSERTLHKDDLMLTRAEWLLKTNQRDKVIEVLRDGLAQNQKLVTVVIPLLQRDSFTREETAAVLPASVDVWIQYGSFLEKMGNLEDAEYFRSHALNFLEGESKIESGWFVQLYNFYKMQQEDAKALEVLRLGVEKLPDYAPFHIWLGDYYATGGIIYRAKEEYQQALLLEPKNEAVRKRIEKITKSEK